MNFKNEIERIKRKLFFLDRTTQTIIQDEVTSLDELTDVTVYEPIQGQTLVYNEVTQQWENETGGGGGTWGSITGTLSNQTDLQTALNLKANLASPTFTGTPAAPTASNGTNTTQLATTAFVQTAVGSSPYNTGGNLFLYYNFY